MLRTIECEAPKSRVGDTIVYHPAGQSQLRYTFSDPERGIYEGGIERSFGISQIHLPDHPHVSKAQAQDPDFSVEFMAKAFKEGNQSWWTCYRKLYSM